MPSVPHLIILLVVVMLLFGGSRLGEIGKGLGEGIRNFRKGVSSDDEDDDSAKKKLSEGEKAVKDEKSP